MAAGSDDAELRPDGPTAAGREPPLDDLFEPLGADAADEVDEAAPPDGDAPAPVVLDPRRLRTLRVLLTVNLALMVAVLLLPARRETGRRPAPPPLPVPVEGTDTPRPAPAVETARAASLGLPPDGRYERALRAAADGDFAAAAAGLSAMLDEEPGMNPAVRRLLHLHLAYYLRKTGHIAEALRHENRYREEMGRVLHPEELLRSARAAERSGDLRAMRRCYARFLLQQDLSPALAGMLAEAELQLGESYRLEAAEAQR